VAPVTTRATRIAFSTASAPPFVKKNVSMSPGVISASFAPRPRPRFRGHERIRVGQGGRLLLDGLHHLRMRVADVRAHELAVEVEEALALRRPEVDAFRARDRDGIDLRLHRPLEDRVLAAEGDDLLSAQVTDDFGRLGGHQRALSRIQARVGSNTSARAFSPP
jgi:hypothetical protein